MSWCVAVGLWCGVCRARGMYPRDAFRAFNYSHSGFLTCSELYGGLDWLGLQVRTNRPAWVDT